MGGQVVDDRVFWVVHGREVDTEGKVDNVEVIGEIAVTIGIERPVEGRDGEICPAGAAEDLQRVQRGLRCHSRRDLHGKQVIAGQRPVVAMEGGAVGVDTDPGGGSGDMGAVPGAVDRIRVRVRDGLVAGVFGHGIVILTDEVVTADDLRGRDERAGRVVVRCIPAVNGAGATEISMGVVDSGVDDADGDTVAAQPRGVPGVEHLRQLGRSGVADGLGDKRGDLHDVGGRGQSVQGLFGRSDADARNGVHGMKQFLCGWIHVSGGSQQRIRELLYLRSPSRG